MLPEHEAHTRTRLESFSDIVFGFSLAQLAIALPAPSAISHLRLFDIFVFIAAFAFVSFVWWRHHLIFRDYFVPEIASIVLNFVMLAAVALTTYAIEVQTRGNLATPAVVLYAAVVGSIFVTMAAMTHRGLLLREHLSAESVRGGKRQRLMFGLVGGIFLASIALLPLGVDYVLGAWFVAVLARLLARTFT